MEDIFFREEKKIASMNKRIISFLIDEFVVAFIILLAFYDKFKMAKSYEEMIVLTDEMLIFIIILQILYHYIFVAIYGKTLGKIVTKLRVVDIETLDNPSHFRAFIRSVVRYFDEAFFYLGLIYAFADPLNRAIHDLVGRAVVIEDS